jgi:hypothetical protein
MSDKIKPHHLGRKAILYVRQSSAHQVTHNQESRILQYAMRDRLYDLGWREIARSKSLTTISVARRTPTLLHGQPFLMWDTAQYYHFGVRGGQQ